jgi:hypothetical protein
MLGAAHMTHVIASFPVFCTTEIVMQGYFVTAAEIA